MAGAEVRLGVSPQWVEGGGESPSEHTHTYMCTHLPSRRQSGYRRGSWHQVGAKGTPLHTNTKGQPIQGRMNGSDRDSKTGGLSYLTFT